MQGESDNNPNLSTYFSQLTTVIQMFRSQGYFDSSKYFVANETGWSPYANDAIRMLRTDGDSNTDYSRGEHQANDPFYALPKERTSNKPTHFDAASLRKIGRLVAEKYLNEHSK